MQTATNFFGPFLLTNLLLPQLTDRVVTVTSQLHRQGKLNLDDLDWRYRKYHQMGAFEARWSGCRRHIERFGRQQRQWPVCGYRPLRLVTCEWAAAGLE